MVVTADTSFLFSLYGEDANSAKAVNFIKTSDSPISLTMLNIFELENALRFASFKQFYTSEEAAQMQNDIDSATKDGRLIIARISLNQIIETARKLSENYTQTGGHRSFDILHVAAAIILKADVFLTFDKNQTRLAQQMNLNCPLVQ